jgi:hypothetical protein
MDGLMEKWMNGLTDNRVNEEESSLRQPVNRASARLSINPPIHHPPPFPGAGEVAEWSIAAVLKTASALPPTGVRIPPSPPALERVVGYLDQWMNRLLDMAAAGLGRSGYKSNNPSVHQSGF